MSRETERPVVQGDEQVIVPLRDEPMEGRIYSAWMPWAALLGGALGAVPLGWLAWAVVEGDLPIVGAGQFAASGAGVAAFTGAGVGFAAGALVGGLVAVYLLPRPRTSRQLETDRSEPRHEAPGRAEHQRRHGRQQERRSAGRPEMQPEPRQPRANDDQTGERYAG